MEDFLPKHFSYAADNLTKDHSNSKDFVIISDYKNIIVSKSLKNKMVENNGILHYTILMDSKQLNYSELILINNAISVVNTSYFYVILLESGNLIYIVKSNLSENIQRLNVLNNNLNGMHIEYLSLESGTVRFSVFSNNTLYLIMYADLTISEVEDVIGYKYCDINLLIVNSKNIISSRKYITSKYFAPIASERIDKSIGLNIKSFKVFEDVDITDIKYIFMNHSYVVAIYKDDKVLFYMLNSWLNNWYYRIKDLIGIKTIDYSDKYLLCTMEDGRLLIANNMGVSTRMINTAVTSNFTEYFNVERYLVGLGCITIIHFDGSIEKVYVMKSHVFLIKECMSLKELLFTNYNPKYAFIPYITVQGTIKIYNKETEDFIELDTLLDVEHLHLDNKFELKLNGDIACNYI